MKNEKGMPVQGSGQSAALALGAGQSGLSLYSDPGCATSVTAVSIETGKPAAALFGKASSAGSLTVSATSSGLTAASATLVVTEKSSSSSTSGTSTPVVASKLAVVGPDKIYANLCVPYGIRRLSADNAPAPHTADLNLSVASSGTVTAILYSDQNCSVTATQVVLKAGWPDTKFFAKAPSTGSITLTATHPASSPSITAGTRAVTIDSGSLQSPPT